MKLYIQAVDDDGEVIGVFEPMVTCEDCKYFWQASKYGNKDECTHPGGPINPMPDGFCNYGKEKDNAE